jgi:hypothetical protein
MPICNTIDCEKIPRIFIQTEQMIGSGTYFLPQMTKCHQSPLCIVWEYSDYNYNRLETYNLTDSVMLLPMMHQARLGEPKEIIPLKNRSVDVAFYGYIGSETMRRFKLRAQFNPTVNLNFVFSQDLDMNTMVNTYTNTKICLIPHVNGVGALETHRLSEISRFGCIPIVETVNDRLLIQPYQECGDVTFTDFDNLLNASIEMVSKIQSTPASILVDNMSKRLEWWRDGVHWESLLTDIFGAKNPGLR